ncbi:hypothetical protein L1987_18711 [Smallanthus sonchifolius]|uniref:Uncharacterized protein n=1 Tax=Smallanthus sonchifolius TaxID=185202 RepID=A0ACB9J0Z8_9ASTR|nr:hypothetical protein L1987_18711 [Smallanthus sonchifolius]
MNLYGLLIEFWCKDMMHTFLRIQWKRKDGGLLMLFSSVGLVHRSTVTAALQLFRHVNSSLHLYSSLGLRHRSTLHCSFTTNQAGCNFKAASTATNEPVSLMATKPAK